MLNLRSKNVTIIKALFVIICLSLIFLLPEVLSERIYPKDGALFAANGAFFLAIWQDLADFVSAPFNWVMEYFSHYPALFIRRHPPVFGIAESIIFAILGISAVSAKMTVCLFSIFWIVGWYLMILEFFKSKTVAFVAALLTLSLPWSVRLSSTVWVDVPSIMFLTWALYFYTKYLNNEEQRRKYAILIVVFLGLSLYTYQLTIFGVMSIFLHQIIIHREKILRIKEFYILGFLLALLIIPLVIMTIKFAPENVNPIISGENIVYKDLAPVKSRFSFENFTYYFSDILKFYPVVFIGLIIWLISKIRFKPEKGEIFFITWFVLGYLGFSLIPTKLSRYTLHFVIALMPLTAIGVWGLAEIVASGIKNMNIRSTVFYILVVIMFFLNVVGVNKTDNIALSGMSKVSEMALKENGAQNVLYHGEFECAFIFYARKLDCNRSVQVFRTANQLTDPENIYEDIIDNEIDLVVFESNNLRRGEAGGIYDSFHDNLGILLKNADYFQYIDDHEVFYGKPGEMDKETIELYKVNH